MDEGRKRTLVYAFGLSGFVLLAIVLVLIVTMGSGGGTKSNANGDINATKMASAMRAAGCTYKQYAMPAPNGDMHVTTLTAHPAWVTSPPSGGQHYYTPAPFNFYDEIVNPLLAVHNLEHGGVVIWYGPKISASTKQEVRNFYNQSPTAILATPYKGLGTKIALAAWTGDPANYQQNGYYGTGHFSLCTTFNEKGFKTFRDAFRGKGPERFPMSALGPGQ
jgi:uncharacterized protein DUF3105